MILKNQILKWFASFNHQLNNFLSCERRWRFWCWLSNVIVTRFLFLCCCWGHCCLCAQVNKWYQKYFKLNLFFFLFKAAPNLPSNGHKCQLWGQNPQQVLVALAAVNFDWLRPSAAPCDLKRLLHQTAGSSCWMETAYLLVGPVD